MRSCPRCMAENLDTDRFCKQCAAPLQQSGGKTCPSGRHTMDPAWTECFYCKQENVVAPARTPAPPARFATVIENQTAPRSQGRPIAYKEETPLPPRPARPLNTPSTPAPPPAAAQPSIVESGSNRQRSQTVYRVPNQPTPDPGQTTPSTASRKIVGLLISYTWNPHGQIYPIREGRNFIGRDKECEVCVPEDQTLSGRNSHITYRQNFVVGDMVSMAGTDVNGVPIEEQFHSLENYATIRAGSTYFTFIAIEPRSLDANVV